MPTRLGGNPLQKLEYFRAAELLTDRDLASRIGRMDLGARHETRVPPLQRTCPLMCFFSGLTRCLIWFTKSTTPLRHSSTCPCAENLSTLGLRKS